MKQSSASLCPRVSVVIPTYNRGDILANTIGMALAQRYSNFEVIVVDQSRELPEAVTKLLESSPEHLRYLRISTPNLPGARNAGVRAADGQIIAFIDDDVVIGPDYVSGIMTQFQDPEVGGVMGMTLSPNGVAPTPEEVLHRFAPCKALPDGRADVGWIVGCNSAYRKSAFIEAGMSDEKFTGGAWSEDVDLAVRVRHLGYKLRYDPSIQLVHLELPSGGCANRSAVEFERRETERYRLFLYFSVKNRAILGLPEVGLNIWRTYRLFALNRSILRQAKRLIKRQFLFVKSLLLAIQMCANSIPVGKDSSLVTAGVDGRPGE